MRTAEPIELNVDERAYLQTWVHRGHAAARIQTRARILLKLAEGWRDVEIARTFAVGVGTVYPTRQRFLAGGLQEVLHAHWTLRRLAGKAVELGYVPSISPETIRQALKKTNSRPGSMSSGVCRAWARRLSRRWKRSSTSTRSRRIPSSR
jgi:Homeodomain-like domain